ncbi:MAG: GNAT family N-acyltransferase, partial [Nakamurella sp.]
DDVLAAQHLRRAVFAEDGDAPASSEGRQTLMYGLSGGGPIEQYFDDRSDHVLVWHQPTDGRPQLVATARLLPPHANDASPRSAGLVADQYFGLRPLERLLNSTVEVSRLCVHPEHRGGAAVALLLGGIARYQHLTGYRYLLGQVPIDLGDGGHSAAAVWDLALSSNVAPAERRCRPRDPIAIGGLPRSPYPAVPPMLHACLRLGAKVCGPPGYNQLAHTADFLVLLDVHERDRGRLPGFD